MTNLPRPSCSSRFVRPGRALFAGRAERSHLGPVPPPERPCTGRGSGGNVAGTALLAKPPTGCVRRIQSSALDVPARWRAIASPKDPLIRGVGAQNVTAEAACDTFA